MSIYDLYIRDNIMTACEDYFRKYLEKEGVPEEHLTPLERELIYLQIDNLIAIISDIYKNTDEKDPDSKTIDKLIGICVVGKMNEARLCRLLNMATKED